MACPCNQRQSNPRRKEYNSPWIAAVTSLPRNDAIFLKMNNNKIHIGTIRGAHGVKGLVRVAVYADDLSLFNTLENFKITLKNKHKGDVWLSHIEGITNKEGADALKGTDLYCDRSDLNELTENEIYFDDLIGRTCIDENGKVIGAVASIDNFGAGDLMDIKPPTGHNFFLSYDDDTILKIEDKITVRLPKVI